MAVGSKSNIIASKNLIVVIVSFRLVSVRMNLRMPAQGIHDGGDAEQES